MISNIKSKKPVDSSLAITAVSLGGIGVLAPQLAMKFEAHLSEVISGSSGLMGAVLQNKIAAAQPAYRRNKKWFFKTIYRYLKIDSGYIELSGMELAAVSKLLKKELGMTIYPKNTYLIPVAEAEKMLLQLNTIDRSC